MMQLNYMSPGTSLKPKKRYASCCLYALITYTHYTIWLSYSQKMD